MIRIKHPRYLILSTAWIVLYLIPLLIVARSCRPDIGLCPLRFHHYETRVVLLSLLLTFLLETALLSTVCSLAARSRILKLILWFFLTLYFAILALSTLQYENQGKFLSYEQLPLIPFLLDPVFLRYNVTQTDGFMFIQSVIIGVVISSFWILYRSNTAGIEPRRVFRQLTMIGGICLILIYAPPGPHILDRHSLSFSRLLALNNIAPQLSAGWSQLFFGAREPTFEKAESKLVRINPNLATTESHSRKSNQNILVLVVEALRSDILSVKRSDNMAIMPFSWDLMSKGISFEYAYTTAPETEGSMYSIITGLYPLRGETRHYGGYQSFPITRIYDLLSQAGYRTGYFTWEWESMKWFSKSRYLDVYQDPYLLDPEYVRNQLPSDIAEKNEAHGYRVTNGDRYNIARLKEWISDSADQRPFFGISYLFSSHFAHNWPADAPSPYAPYTLAKELSFLGYPREVMPVVRNRYYNSLRFIDGLIADVLEHLSKLNLSDNTTVIVTGDHGELFHEHGSVTHAGFLYEPAIRVPLIVFNLPKNLCIFDTTSPVSLLDLAPSILTLTNLPPHPNFQGRSFIDSCHGLKRKAEPIFASVQLNTNEDAVISWPWKFVRNYTQGTTRLYNLETDPDENSNLTESNPSQSSELSQLLSSFRNKQLTYFGDSETSKHFYPPKIDSNLQFDSPRRSVN